MKFYLIFLIRDYLKDLVDQACYFFILSKDERDDYLLINYS